MRGLRLIFTTCTRWPALIVLSSAFFSIHYLINKIRLIRSFNHPPIHSFSYYSAGRLLLPVHTLITSFSAGTDSCETGGEAQNIGFFFIAQSPLVHLTRHNLEIAFFSLHTRNLVTQFVTQPCIWTRRPARTRPDSPRTRQLLSLWHRQ